MKLKVLLPVYTCLNMRHAVYLATCTQLRQYLEMGLPCCITPMEAGVWLKRMYMYGEVN